MDNFTPTRVGYECAAFVKYRVPYGADQDRRIECNPSWMWGIQSEEAYQYRSFKSLTYQQYHTWLAEKLTQARRNP